MIDWRAKLFLPQTDEAVTLPKRVVQRGRGLLVHSLLLNVLLFWGLISASNTDRRQRAIVADSAKVAASANHMTNLYRDQINDLTQAYRFYGEAVQSTDAETQRRLWRTYDDHLQSFNQRSEALVRVAEDLKRKANRVSEALRP